MRCQRCQEQLLLPLHANRTEDPMSNVSIPAQGVHDAEASSVSQCSFLAAPLPPYSSEPSFLSPDHCRFCFQAVASNDMATHLQSCAKCSVQEYRRVVLRKALAEWPQRIPAQLLRSRLAAFKQELCDATSSHTKSGFPPDLKI